MHGNSAKWQSGEISLGWLSDNLLQVWYYTPDQWKSGLAYYMTISVNQRRHLVIIQIRDRVPYLGR